MSEPLAPAIYYESLPDALRPSVNDNHTINPTPGMSETAIGNISYAKFNYELGRLMG